MEVFGVNRQLVKLMGFLISYWELHLRNQTSKSLLSRLGRNPIGPSDFDHRPSA
jgi:hypothetical protein